MRIIHTSDWHLGKSFGPISLRSDQEDFADWFVDLVRSDRPDLVVIAGDLFDRAIAPVESIDLFSETIRRLLATGVVVAAITGNHDAPNRVAPHPDLLDASGLYLRGGYHRIGEVTTHDFDDGPVDLVLLPFLDPQAAPDEFGIKLAGHDTKDEAEPQVEGESESDLFTDHLITRRRSRTHESVLTTAIDIARPQLRSPRSVAIAHAFVAGSVTSESERQLVVGGTAGVPSSIFDGFSYTALGHLHKPQAAGAETIRYSGTPLAYSYSEDHEKSIVAIEITPEGACSIETIPIEVGRRVRTITGTIDELLEPDRFPDAVDCFVRAEVTNRETVLDARARLAEIYPFVTEVQLLPEGAQPALGAAPVTISELEPIDMVNSFWEVAEGSPPEEAVQKVLADAVERALGRVAAREDIGAGS